MSSVKAWILKHRTETILALVAVALISIQQLFFPLAPSVELAVADVVDFQLTPELIRYYSRETAEIIEADPVTLSQKTASEEFNFIERIWWNSDGTRFIATFENSQPASSANPLFAFDRPLNATVSTVYTPADGANVLLPRVVNSAVWVTATRIAYHGDGLNQRVIYAFDLESQRETPLVTLAESGAVHLAIQSNGQLAVAQNQRLLRFSPDLKTKQETTVPYSITALTFTADNTVLLGVQRRNGRPAIAKGNLETDKFSIKLLRGMPKRGAITRIDRTSDAIVFVLDDNLYRVQDGL